MTIISCFSRVLACSPPGSSSEIYGNEISDNKFIEVRCTHTKILWWIFSLPNKLCTNTLIHHDKLKMSPRKHGSSVVYYSSHIQPDLFCVCVLKQSTSSSIIIDAKYINPIRFTCKAQYVPGISSSSSIEMVSMCWVHWMLILDEKRHWMYVRQISFQLPL